MVVMVTEVDMMATGLPATVTTQVTELLTAAAEDMTIVTAVKADMAPATVDAKTENSFLSVI